MKEYREMVMVVKNQFWNWEVVVDVRVPWRVVDIGNRGKWEIYKCEVLR
jgi:hypothetical protein